MNTTDRTVTAVRPAAPPPGAAGADARAPAAVPAGPPADGGPRTRERTLPLGTRFLLLAAALIGVPLGLAIGVTAWHAPRVAAQSVRDALEGAHAACRQITELRARQLQLIVRLVANDPAFVAYVAEGDAPSTADLLAARRQSLGCDFAIVLDRSARVIARTDRPGGAGVDRSADPLVVEALAAGEAAGVWRDGDRLYLAAAAPLLAGGRTVEGVFVAGFAMSDAVALELKRMTGAEASFVIDDSVRMRVVASTLAAGGEALPAALGPALGRAVAGEGAMLPRVWLERRAWGARIEPLRDAAGAPVGAVVTLASLDAALAPFRRIEGMLVAVGLLALAVALAASWAATRRLSGPLERLAAAADAARQGRLDVPVEVTGGDEVGRLARAFRSLLAELREERETAAFLAARSRALADAPEPVAPAGALAPGTVLGGRFELLSLLGVGGMGVVYRARDRELGDVVALKTLRGERTGDEDLERMKGELRLARRITHRNVVRVHDFGRLEEVAFISMEYVQGVSLRDLLRAGVPPVAVSLRIARQVAAGLAAAHEAGVVHHDLKPENVVFEPGGNAKLMDFGIARVVHRGDERRTFAGTLGYAAPEVMRGGEGGPPSDVFAFGVMLHELLGGRRPWSGADPQVLIDRMLNEPPSPLVPAPGAVSPSSPAGALPFSPGSAVLAIAAIVDRCLAREPDDRFPDGHALREALDGVPDR